MSMPPIQNTACWSPNSLGVELGPSRDHSQASSNRRAVNPCTSPTRLLRWQHNPHFRRWQWMTLNAVGEIRRLMRLTRNLRVHARLASMPEQWGGAAAGRILDRDDYARLSTSA